jgi:hypothetical protein
VNLLSVNKKWAKSITNLEDGFQFVPLGYKLKQLLMLLCLEQNPDHLDLVVTARAVASEAGTQDEAENKDKVGDIKKTYYSRTDARFPPSLIQSNSGFL